MKVSSVHWKSYGVLSILDRLNIYCYYMIVCALQFITSTCFVVTSGMIYLTEHLFVESANLTPGFVGRQLN